MDAKTDLELQQRFSAEFEALAQAGPIAFEISALEAWVIMSHIQLALRHPANRGPSSKIAVELARRLKGVIAISGALEEVFEMGWNPEYDQPA